MFSKIAIQRARGANAYRGYILHPILFVGLACCMALNLPAQRAPSVPNPSPDPLAAAGETVVLPKSVPDPLEPLNRAVWAFNRGLINWVVKPTARVYRFIIRKPIRIGIANSARNIT